ncbi:GRB10-interacting GYF protein 2-like [Papaver somniferum]|uniref:GRB10-interacting GYF protein 2-like n=1 Tax=Papaver somniferum TaxID=3469 RepID=UPI000E6F759E|nr:GRB10-interacting GYF protein 2-like [Papaver somniferum]
MSSSKSQKTTSSQASEDGQQTINERSVAARLRWEKKRQSDREKQEQLEREAMLKFEQQLQAEDIRREREQFIADRIKMRRVEGQRRRRLKEEEKKHERKRQELLNIRSAGSGQAIKQHEGEHINSLLDASTFAVCGGEVNLGGKSQRREQLMRQQTQSNDIVLDDKEYRQRVLDEKQRQTQVNSESENVVPVYLARKYKKYNDRRKDERASKKEPVQKVKSTKQVSATRFAAQKAR